METPRAAFVVYYFTEVALFLFSRRHATHTRQTSLGEYANICLCRLLRDRQTLFVVLFKNSKRVLNQILHMDNSLNS
jgi:hypothetical protein